VGWPRRTAKADLTLSVSRKRGGILRAVKAFALTAGVVGTGGLLTGCTDEQPRPDIILVSIDSLRADNLGCYGYPRKTSPFVDQLASEGVRFENAIKHYVVDTALPRGPVQRSLRFDPRSGHR